MPFEHLGLSFTGSGQLINQCNSNLLVHFDPCAMSFDHFGSPHVWDLMQLGRGGQNGWILQSGHNGRKGVGTSTLCSVSGRDRTPQGVLWKHDEVGSELCAGQGSHDNLSWPQLASRHQPGIPRCFALLAPKMPPSPDTGSGNGQIES